MDDPLHTPEPNPQEERLDPGSIQESSSFPAPVADLTSAPGPQPEPPQDRRADVIAMYADAGERKRSFRNNLFLLLALTLTAFILSSWILVRVDSPFGAFSNSPQDVVRAQLRALDRGELRPAYDMFSPRYRGQVSFDIWHELFITHWRMFHADVVRSETPAQDDKGVTLEIYLHAADDKDYRARFTLIRADGRWWIDDVHWEQEPDERELSRT